MPDVARFVSVDPLAEDFKALTTYQYASNSPIVMIDLDGLEGVPYFMLQPLVQNAVGNPNGVGAHAIGITQGLANTVVGIYDAVTDPLGTLEGAGNMLVAGLVSSNPSTMMAVDNALGTNSFGTSAAISKGFQDDVDDVLEGNGIERGAVFGETIGAIALAKGTSAVLRGMSPASKTTNVSPNVRKVLNAIDEIKAEGEVIPNDLKFNQEVNLTFVKGTDKLNIRVETHVVPKKFGGNGTTPQRHLNVETVPAKKNTLPNKGHKILENDGG